MYIYNIYILRHISCIVQCMRCVIYCVNAYLCIIMYYAVCLWSHYISITSLCGHSLPGKHLSSCSTICSSYPTFSPLFSHLLIILILITIPFIILIPEIDSYHHPHVLSSCSTYCSSYTTETYNLANVLFFI